MLSKTIGQLSAATVINDSDLLEIEQAGVSKYGTVQKLVDGVVATTTESLLGTSNSVLMTPLQVREAFSANNDAPVYACRAWATFNGSTVSSSISGTYTRVVGTTETVCIATAHGFISGNQAFVDFTSGGASDNSYIITVVDPNTFKINTVSTSSIIAGDFTLPRCPVLASGNINNVSRISLATYHVNFSVGMQDENYSIAGTCKSTALARTGAFSPEPLTAQTQYSIKMLAMENQGTGNAIIDTSFASIAIFR